MQKQTCWQTGPNWFLLSSGILPRFSRGNALLRWPLLAGTSNSSLSWHNSFSTYWNNLICIQPMAVLHFRLPWYFMHALTKIPRLHHYCANPSIFLHSHDLCPSCKNCTLLVSISHSTILRLSGFCPGQPGWAGTRRNIHPLTSIMVISRPLSASSIYYMASSLFKLRAWQSFSTVSKFSLVYLLAWYPLLHTPYISSPNRLLSAAHAHTIALACISCRIIPITPIPVQLSVLLQHSCYWASDNYCKITFIYK